MDVVGVLEENLEGFRAYYCMKPYKAKTAAEKASISIEGEQKWLTQIKNAEAHRTKNR